MHSESVELGSLAVVPPPVAPDADLAADQLAAVDHRSGPARVIAPAGSGKTRVLTERLRHLHVDRGYEPSTVLAVAYNKQAQLEMEARTAAFRPRVRTLNSLGLWVVAEHRGGSPPVLDEPDVRRMIDALLPGRRQRRANTDPIGPYIEGLTAIRLGLTDPEVVEASRDDVAGLAELFPAYRRRLAERRAVDFDEQVYAAVEALLRDGPFRRSMQRSCRHLLVDEFQDLTPAHVLLLRLLAIPALDVFGVGDDDQCIYGYAGADPAFLIDYGQLFPGATPHPLQVNYRCPTEVVAGARTLLGYNHRRVAKVIEPGPAADPTAGALRVIEHGAHDGATALVELLREWLGEPGVEPSSIAVLTRVNSLLLAPHVAAPRGRAAGHVGAAPGGPRAHRHARRARLPAPRHVAGRAGRRRRHRGPAPADRAACRSGSRNGSTGAHGGRSPSWQRSPTRCRRRRPARCCASSTTSRSSSTPAATARRVTCWRRCATTSAWARR